MRYHKDDASPCQDRECTRAHLGQELPAPEEAEEPWPLLEPLELDTTNAPLCRHAQEDMDLDGLCNCALADFWMTICPHPGRECGHYQRAPR